MSIQTVETPSSMPAAGRPRLQLSLRRQIIVTLLCATVAVAFGSGIVMKRLESDYLREKINQQSEATLNILSAAALEAVIAEDQPMLATIVYRVARENDEILRIEILNEEGILLARWQSESVPERVEPLSFSKMISLDGEAFGSIAIDWNIASVQEEINRHALIMQLGVGLGISLLAIIIIALMESMAIRPINSISERLREFAQGTVRRSQTPSTFSSSELQRLNEVVDNLGEALEAKDQREEELRETMAKLQQAQKMETVGNLTGGIAHDFNNLLGVLIGNLDLLKEILSDDAEATELVEEALEAGLRGKELNRRMLAFARRQSLKPEILDVNEVLTSMTKLLQRSLGEQIEISLRCSVNAWPIKVDPSQLETAILNLAINARDAMSNGGHLVLETSNVTLDESYVEQDSELKPGDYVMLAVTDAGTGIPKEILKHVFDPFFTTKEVGRGSGLGLSMVQGFIKQSGGNVTIYSEAGHGTTVRLYLPRDRGDAEVASDVAGKAEEPHGAGQTVLVVEDNDGMRRVAKKQLVDLGYQVVEADKAITALELLKSGRRIDLVFSDVIMPGDMDGIGLAKIIRQLYPELPVLLTSGFTARSTADNREPELERVKAELLAKPYRKEELAWAISRNLRAA